MRSSEPPMVAFASTYPRPLLAVEVVNGTLGTLVMALFLEAVKPR